MVDKLTEKQIEDFKEAFRLFDKNGDGTISARELKETLQELGQDATDEEVIMMISSVDTEGNGRIELQQFMTLMSSKMKNSDPQSELLEAFKAFDKDGNGFISAAELKHVMTCMGEKMTDAEINAMIEEADMDGDGQINYNEFVELMTGN